MELYTLKINVTNQRLSFGENPPEIFSGDQSIDFVEFTFTDDTWNFPNIWAIFSRQKGSAYQIALDDNKVMIPAEVMQKRGYIYIGLMATDGENVQTSSVLQYSIRQGAANVETVTPSPSIYEQFLNDLEEYQEAIHNLETLTATAETLAPGSEATASFDNGVLTLGIPKGDTGATGNGILSITKTGTSGSVDTYTIKYTNGSTTTFTVTNGEVTQASFDSLKSKVSNIDKNTFALMTTQTSNGFLNVSGVFISNANYRTTGYIPVKNGDSFKYKIGHATTLPIIAFYTAESESSKDTTKFVTGANAYTEGTYSVTADGYVRFCYYYTRTEGYVIFQPLIPDNVVAHFAPLNGVQDLNILCLGDSIFGQTNNVTNPLAELTGANVINGAVGGTRAVPRGGGHGFDDFDGENLITALCTNTWTDQDAGAAAISGAYPWITAKLATLKSVDMSQIDLLTFNYGTNDYAASTSMADIIAAHNSIIDTLRAYYPGIRIVIISPIWRFKEPASSGENGDNYAYNVNTLKEISNAIVSNAHDRRITVFDAYKNMPLDYETAPLYFNPGSGVHLNSTGGRLFAHYLNGFINSIY